MWRHQLDGLADEFRVIAVDLPGHGALAGVPFGLAGAADLVAAIIGEAGGPALVVGQSLGGYVAMDLAARRPGLVAGLVLASATVEPRSVLRRAPLAIGQYLAEMARDRVAGGPGATRAGEDSDHPVASGLLFRGALRTLARAPRERFVPRLAAYGGPTLLVNGREDRVFRRDELRFLEAVGYGRLVVIPGAGHRVSEEQPALFDAAVRGFAAEVARGAAQPGGGWPGGRPGGP